MNKIDVYGYKKSRKRPSVNERDLYEPLGFYEEPSDNDMFNEDVEDESLNDDITDELDDVDDQEVVNDVDKNKELGTQLVKILRQELEKKECSRDYLSFRYRGEIYDGVPMAEINPSKFVFKIDNILKAINLSEIKIL